jgi:hypothetical protein
MPVTPLRCVGMRCTRWTILAALLLHASTLSAQVARDGYYHHLPPMPRLVAETKASARLGLYGNRLDPKYIDRAPRDGIDDRRARRLLALAQRFSPILRRNNFSRPVDFRDALGGRPVLRVDTWRARRLVRSDSVLLDDPLRTARSMIDPELTAERDRTDSLLLALIEKLGPDARPARVVRPEHDDELVLYFDFPGHDERTWRSAFSDQHDSRILAHFFVHEDAAATGVARFTLAIQYWFFYPFNDGPNNHEGDWEHITVLVTTPERAGVQGPTAGLLTASDVTEILTSRDIDALVIRSVEYYFHESVVVLDYLQARGAEPSSRWRELRHLHIWEQPDFFRNAVVRRLRALEGRLATHPVVYIGGNNKGPDELMKLVPRFRGSYNRNGHGSYPFAGTWQGVGPLGATEQMAGRVVPTVRGDFDPRDRTASLKGQFVDDHFMAYDAEDITVVPDWERVVDLVSEDPEVRRSWAWLLLPIRWGFPASGSPGAGLIEHTDLGQVAPEGPAFQPTWNRLAAATGFQVFRPRVLRVVLAPMTPWDKLQNGWGLFNVPVALLGFLAGWNVVLAQLGPWITGPLEMLGAAPPKTFAPQRRPYRFTSVGIGQHHHLGGREFARLLPTPGDDALSGLPADPSFGIDPATTQRSQYRGLKAWFNLHYGPRFTVQNTYTKGRSSLAYTAVSDGGSPPARVRGTLEIEELTGGFRYRLAMGLGDVVQPFVGAGWGWTWYEVAGVTLDGQPLDYQREGGYPTSILPSARWWPNTLYGVAGIELLSPRESWILERLGYGLQIEITALRHRLGANRPGASSLGAVATTEIGVGLVLSW